MLLLHHFSHVSHFALLFVHLPSQIILVSIKNHVQASCKVTRVMKLTSKLKCKSSPLLASLNGLQNHFRKTESTNPSLHFFSFGYSISSILSIFSNQIVGIFRSSSVCRTTCIASRFNCALRRTDSMSPTAKPISKFISKMGIRIMKRAAKGC